MFRSLPSYDIRDSSLIALAEVMVQPPEPDTKLDDPNPDPDENRSRLPNGELRLPAGYTYFGQYVDHDITFDPISSLDRQNDPDALVNFRTPKFDLDSLYGRGPSDQPYLYSRDGRPDSARLTLGESKSATAAIAGPDLPRVASGTAIIGDPRNDENLMISQLQVAMIRFHNAVVDDVVAKHPSWSRDDVFKKAQQQVRWHYQWVVIHDFLRRLVGDDVIDDILQPRPFTTSPGQHVELPEPNLRFYQPHVHPFMPLEFSVAAYRYGHTMVRPSYLINDLVNTRPKVEGAERIPIFSDSGIPTQSLNGFRPLPDEWGVEWKYFLHNIKGRKGPMDEFLPQPSYNLDAELSHPLGALTTSTANAQQISAGFSPEIARSLAVRNLLRGKRLSLPSGQDVARAMGIAPIPDAQLYEGLEVADDVLDDLADRAPLWFYVLREADLLGKKAQLGPVGGRIVAEVLIGLLVGDDLSYFNVDPGWTPTLESKVQGTFTLSDLINYGLRTPPQAVPTPAEAREKVGQG